MKAKDSTGTREKELQDLLAKLALKEKRHRLRNIAFVSVPLIAGLIWLAVSVKQVQRVEQRSMETDQKIAKMEAPINEANEILLALASPDAQNRRRAITVDYEISPSQKDGVESTLKGLGFLPDKLKPKESQVPTNTILYDSRVEEVDVKLVAYAFVRAGAEIKRIEALPAQLMTGATPTLIVRVFGESSNNDKPVLTVEEIRDKRLNFAFPVVGSFRSKDNALGWARKVQTLISEYRPQVYLSENGLYAVTLGGYLTEAEAQKRIDFAKSRPGVSTDNPFVRIAPDWGMNIFTDSAAP